MSVASFAKIFSHSVGCLFISLIVSFAVQKLLSLIRSHLFISVFICISLIISDVEHLFMCFLAICLSLEKYLFRSSAYFLIDVWFFEILSCRRCFAYFGD